MPSPNYKLAASLICANPLNLEQDIRLLEAGGIDQIHFDVMDGHFVPRLGLYPELLRSIKTISKLPIDVHMMMDNYEFIIPDFIKAGADYIVVHAEPTQHLHRVVKLIRDLGAKAGVALNITTPLSVLDYVLDDINLVMLMAINPGIVGHKLIPQAYDKIKELKEKIADRPDIIIEIDGGVSPESADKMIKLGANMLVCGTSAIFKPDIPLDVKVKEFRSSIDSKL